MTPFPRSTRDAAYETRPCCFTPFCLRFAGRPFPATTRRFLGTANRAPRRVVERARRRLYINYCNTHFAFSSRLANTLPWPFIPGRDDVSTRNIIMHWNREQHSGRRAVVSRARPCRNTIKSSRWWMPPRRVRGRGRGWKRGPTNLIFSDWTVSPGAAPR